MGLVLWIAIFVKFISDVFGYIDDNFGFDEEGNVAWYGPHRCYYPAKQAKLLELWDEIGLPHDKAKQEYAPVLRIVGFLVDPKLMRVSMDEEDRRKLVQHVSDFAATAPGGTRRTLREFQQLAGWINWSFNVYPLLKPALSNVYAKISSKTESHAKIFVSKAVVRDLEWTQCPPKNTIFYFEALAVVSAVEAVTRLPSIPSRLLVYSDNTNTVDIFHSLRSLPPSTNLLKFTVSLLLKFNISLRVMHVPGVQNTIADSLSRFENTKAVSQCSGLTISPFQPPRVAMGPDL